MATAPPINLDAAFQRAVDNIAAWGDTDVFPLPPENHALYDRRGDVLALLSTMHADYGRWRDQYSPVNESALAMVGYTAFRWVTQIDPIWNAYLLGLVLALADHIERARIPRQQNVVFSYRYEYSPTTHRLFAESAWRDFNHRSIELADRHSHVLVCDIADFYSRIYHHRVENALLALQADAELPKRIDRVLNLFSSGTSYGLPVGGPAARLLSELLLNRVDRLLLLHGVVFCRFADDYHVFTNSREAAYDALRFLTEKLLQNEGLTLQRAKTRILTSKDFVASSVFASAEPSPQSDTTRGTGLPAATREADDTPHEADGSPRGAVPDSGDPKSPLTRRPRIGLGATPATEPSVPSPERSFLALSLRYDPYSPTAKEDYESLREQVERFDIMGMLARELSKSRIHAALTRRLLQAIRYLGATARDGAARSLVDNIETLTPVFPNVMRALTESWDDLGEGTRVYISEQVRQMVAEERYYVAVPVNLGYAVRLLARDPSEEVQALLAQIFVRVPHFVQRDIVLIMARWSAAFWLSDQRLQFSRMHPWVQRAFVMASFVLQDEGDHWRRRISGQLSPFDRMVHDWMHERVKAGNVQVPL